MDQRDISFSLENELGKAATTHAVTELQAKGIRRVRVLDREGLESAARVAINRTLRTQLVGLDLPEGVRAEIERRALAEFSRLVESAETAPATPTSPAGPTTPEMLPEGLGSDATESSLEEGMVRDLGRLLEADWKKEIAQVESHHRSQLELLELRISKLVRALESTDRVLEHLKTQSPDSGLDLESGEGSSELDPQSPLFEKKSQLLSALFEANLELRELESRGSEE